MPTSQNQSATSPSPDPRGTPAPTFGGTAVGDAAVPVTSGTVQGIQLVLHAQEGGAHALQHKHYLLRGCA